MINWIKLLEIHFDKRKKAFLIFDDSNILRYLSGYAQEILGLDESHVGFITLHELFLPSEKTPQFLIDKNYSSHSVQNILYTTPAGLSKELRISKDFNIQSTDDISGYVVWIEAKSRDITGVYKSVSSLSPFLNLGLIFNENNVGFILLNSDGIVEKYNEKMKTFLSEPGDWIGRNIYTFPFLHQHSIDSLITNCMKNKSEVQPVEAMIKTPGYIGSFNVRWSGLALTDPESKLVGVIITASQV